MRRYKTALAVLLFLAIQRPASPEQVLKSSDPDYPSFDECLDRLFEPLPQPLRQEYELYLTARIVEENCDLELTVSRKESSGPAMARLRIASELSFRERAQALAEQGRIITAEELCTPDLLRVIETSSQARPELAALVTRLQELEIPPVAESLLIIHGLIYRISITSGFSESEFEFYAPGRPRPPKGELHPLDSWIEDVRQVLDSTTCPAEGDSGGSQS